MSKSPSRACRQVVQVGADEAGVREAELGRERARQVDRRRLKSAPVTRAPSRAHDSVSIPKWHWRWSRSSAGDVADLVRSRSRGAGSPPRLKPSRS